ncbi:MAG: TrkA family potassium uptake protein [Actinomycetota bacterium]
MYIIIGGGGKVGAALAKTLSLKGHTVVMVEKSGEKCERIAEESPNVLVIKGDACDIRYLEEAGVDRADVLAAVTGDDDDNLVMCQLAKETFNVPRVVARVNDPRNENIFLTLGIEAISSTTVIAKLIEEEATIGDIITLQALKKGRLALVELDLSQDSPVAGKKVSELGFPKDCVLVSIVRGDEIVIPRGSTVLQSGDGVIALTSVEKEENFRNILLGKDQPSRR